MSDKGNRVLSGNEGEVYVNNELWADIESIELKVTGKFEDVNFLGDNRTYKKYTGWDGSGSVKCKKTHSRGIKIMGEAFKTGIMPDIKIVTKLKDSSTNKAERSSVTGVVFTEFFLAKMEAKALLEEELPLFFTDYESIETL